MVGLDVGLVGAVVGFVGWNDDKKEGEVGTRLGTNVGLVGTTEGRLVGLSE